MPLLMLFLRLLLVLLSFFHNLASARLPNNEVDALKIIAKTLRKTTWDFGVDPCDMASTRGRWRNPDADKGSEDSITCDCSFFNGTVCHVTSILLKTQDLQGSLPKELVGLPFLQELNLARNYLTGSIPPEWGALPLVIITLSGNRLTGPIPKEIGNITSLERLVLENNYLSGALPPELGRLSNLQRLYLSSNKFEGKIPSSFSRLTSLRNVRLSDNQFIGTIPDFIGKWKKLEYLVLHSSGLDGPIPQSIARLKKLTELRISDMMGPRSPFPPLQNMHKLWILVLRNLNLEGELPSYLGENTPNLTLLDLSFNKFSGAIPSTYVALRDVKNVYLMGNMLNGSVPMWMVNEKFGNIIDLSYNRLSEDSTTRRCYHNSMNLFASSYTRANNSLNALCLKSVECPETFDELHINCGGADMTINGTLFEADDYDRRPGYSDNTRRGWVSSNTGIFLEDTRGVPRGTTIWSDSSKLNGVKNPGLYAQARLSAISLTYHVLCLKRGSYKVKLHFAEIMFSDTKSYKSLGRRLFDIYIQDVLVLKDFNIVHEAGGVGRAVVKTFLATIEGKLEIRFYWAGKGTVDTPVNGVYGPLISAISIIPDFEEAHGTNNHHDKLSRNWRIVIGVLVSVFVFILMLGCILWWGGCLRRKSQMERDFKKMDCNINNFSLQQIKDATDDFAPANKIGEGGFGPVYKGMMPNGTAIAVKQLADKSKQGNREFLNEIGVISALQHPALIKLHGCCVEGGQLLLVYEYLVNNSLARALFGPLQTQISLDWPTRYKICVGTAKGLAYLHEESRLKILHRDIKAANILLDQDLNPKISDFGLAKLDPEDQSHITTTPVGTFGYMSPEYAQKGHVSDKADVYSFGVLLMEVVHGKSNTTSRPSSEETYFTDWVRRLWKQNKLAEFVDSRLQSFDSGEVLRTVKVAILCTSYEAADRPPMSAVVHMLEGHLTVELDSHMLEGHLTVEMDSQVAAIRDEQSPNLLSVIAEIDAEFDSQEITESPEMSLLRYPLSRKGKEKVGCASFSIEGESSSAAAERERSRVE